MRIKIPQKKLNLIGIAIGLVFGGSSVLAVDPATATKNSGTLNFKSSAASPSAGATKPAATFSVSDDKDKSKKMDDDDDVETNLVELPEGDDDATHKALPEDDEEPTVPAGKNSDAGSGKSDKKADDKSDSKAPPPLPPNGPPGSPDVKDRSSGYEYLPSGDRSVRADLSAPAVYDNAGDGAARSQPKVDGSTRLEISDVPTEPQFSRPADGPIKGGSILLEHPNADKGLMTIDEKNVYHYSLPTTPKDKSFSVRVGSMTSPKIDGPTSAAGPVTFESMYGTNQLIQVVGEYEFQKITRYGIFGLNFGAGFSTGKGSGFFKDPSTFRTNEQSEEPYEIFIVPLNFFGSYRLEFNHRQWVVPYVKAGASMIGLFEYRLDGRQFNYAYAPAVGGGGGLMLSLTKVDPSLQFTINNEYGLSDMYLTLEARAMVGLRADINFTGLTVDAGIVADF